MSEYEKLREMFTSWPAIIIGFMLGGWLGVLLLLWKIFGESAESNNGRMSQNMKKSVFGSESVDSGLYWDRDQRRWVRQDPSARSSYTRSTSSYTRTTSSGNSYSYRYENGRRVATKPMPDMSNAAAVEQELNEVLQESARPAQSSYTRPAAPDPNARRKPQTPPGRPTQTAAPTRAKGKDKGNPFPKLKDGKSLITAGAIMMGIFGFSAAMDIVDNLFILSLFEVIQSAFPLLMFTGIGAGMFLWGRFKNKQAKQLRKLMTIIGDAKRVNLHTLSDAAGMPYKKVVDMVEDMIDAGYLGYQAYINSSTGELVMDGTAPETAQQEAQPDPAANLTTEEDKSLLAQIRAVNDAIPGEEMTRKISRIEEITGHILEVQDKHPEKAPELRKFLSYYLPTTLKILNTYAELDRQKVSGENTTAMKQRIESMMDKVVEGFELQLDKLYADDMMDITSDISVMETMLNQDGLSTDDQYNLKVPKAGTGAAAPYSAGGISLTLDPDPSMTGGSAAAKQ